MKINTFLKGNYQNIIYSILILLPSILTGNAYSLLSEQNSLASTVSNISAISTSIYSGLDDTQNYAAYSLSLLLRHRDFVQFNVAGMGKHISEFLYHNPTTSNIYIIDQTHTILAGINDTQLSGISSSAHVENALKGQLGFYTTFIQNQPFTQFAFPIYSSIPSKIPLGALVVTYNFEPVESEFKALNSSSPDLNAYLFDTNGRILAASSNQSIFWQNRSIDIINIRRGIDYDPFATFTLFDDTPLIATYHVLEDNDWTLLITSNLPEETPYTDIFSWFAGILSLGGISSFEFMRKRKESVKLLLSTLAEEALDPSLETTSTDDITSENQTTTSNISSMSNSLQKNQLSPLPLEYDFTIYDMELFNSTSSQADITSKNLDSNSK